MAKDSNGGDVPSTPKRLWSYPQDNGGRAWHGQQRFGRLQIGFHVYRHAGVLPDRWVFQPWLIWDRQ